MFSEHNEIKIQSTTNISGKNLKICRNKITSS